jgi:hypothetical protein
MTLYEIHTQCGAKIQTTKLTQQERNKTVPLTFCPIVCPLCKRQHGLEVCSIKKLEKLELKQ